MTEQTLGLKKYWKLAGWVLSLAALVFLVRWVIGLRAEVWKTLGDLDPTWLVIALVLFVVWFFMRFWGWEMISRSQGYTGVRRANLRLWALSELMRYVPGNIWSFAARYRGARDGGTTRLSSIISLITEVLALVGGAALVTAFTVPPGWLMLVSTAVAVGSIVGLFLLPKILRRIKRFADAQLIPHVGRLVGWYVLLWVVYGLGSVAVWKAFPQADLMSWAQAFSASVASWLAGYLSFVTPMGLGVREVVFVALVPAAVGASLAGLVALVTRLWFIVSELVFVSFVLLWSRKA